MKLVSFRGVILGWILAFVQVQAQQRAAELPGQDIEAGLFQLKEMDMHLHAGMERQIDLQSWVDLAVADGRKVLLLLDHIELYRVTQPEYEAWAKERGFPMWYPVGGAGHRALFEDFDKAAARKDVLIFKGWEIDSRELDAPLEKEPMQMAEVLGWHISPNNGGEAPNGRLLLKRARQLRELQKEFPVPMILFHPFSMRIENLQRAAQKEGRDPKTLTVEEYRFFQPGEQEELVQVLRGSSVYIEIPHGLERCMTDPVLREALVADIKPLAEAGVQFTVSTDNHSVEAARRLFTPEVYCDPLGVTPRNTNTIVRELLAIRAKRGLSTAKTTQVGHNP